MSVISEGGPQGGLVRPAGALAVAVVLTLLALLENSVAPWAPYYGLYALAVTALPLLLGTARFGSLRRVRWWAWPGGIGLAVLLQVAAGVLLVVLYPRLLGLFGVTPEAAAGPFWSFQAALPEMLQTAARRLGGEVGFHSALYLGLVALWAGLGEELFYRGYVQEVLRRRWNRWAALLLANLLFAIRHAAQLALVEPYPWGAAAAWVAFAFVAGLVFGWLYERTGSLWLPVWTHYWFNLIPLLLGGLG